MKERKLSSRAIDALCGKLYAGYRPLSDAEQRQYASVTKQLLLNKEQQLNQSVWLVLKFLLDESFDGPAKDETPQSEKLHRRWWVVAGLKKKRRLSWVAAYRAASFIYRDTPWAGSARTMKEAYQLVERVRRAILHAEDEAKANAKPEGLRRAG
jgi:hypothetical protein